MAKTPLKNTQTIDTDLTNDLHFQVLEVKRVCDLAKTVLLDLNPDGIEAVERYATYVYNLRSRIETLSYEAIFNLRAKDKELILTYRALIRVSVNLKVITDYFVQASRQVAYVKNPESFSDFPLTAFFTCIEEALENIHTAFTEVDQSLAKQICDSEEALDNLYLDYFNVLQDQLQKKSKSADMLTLLFIIRYLERIGDCFLKIGEGILNISVGDALNIKHYKNIEAVVADLTGKSTQVDYDFKPFLFSRSGCKVGRLDITEQNGQAKNMRLFYKQGDSAKIKGEIAALKKWHKKFPKSVPQIKWESHSPGGSTLVVNYLEGANLLNFVLEKGSTAEVKKAADALAQRIETIWSAEKQQRKSASDFVSQINKRKRAIEHVHEDFFEAFKSEDGKEKIDFSKALKRAKKLEKKVHAPFSVWCHGDFNLDNIIYNPKNERVRFIDVHRSGYGDYAQELSVFMVSMLRIQSEDKQVKEKTALLIARMYQLGTDFAHQHKDPFFQARLAFGLFRSLVTSTRFLQDDVWYHQLRMWAWRVLQSLEADQDNLKQYQFNPQILLKK